MESNLGCLILNMISSLSLKKRKDLRELYSKKRDFKWLKKWRSKNWLSKNKKRRKGNFSKNIKVFSNSKIYREKILNTMRKKSKNKIKKGKFVKPMSYIFMKPIERSQVKKISQIMNIYKNSCSCYKLLEGSEKELKKQ